MALIAGLPGKLDNDEEVENKGDRIDVDTYNRLHMLKFLVEAMTGKKIKFVDAPRRDDDDVEWAGDEGEAGEAGLSIEYHYSEYRFEQEVLTFEASGVINTAGGARTSFAIKFTMTRTYYSERTFDLVAAEAGDGSILGVDASSASGTAFSARGSIDTGPGDIASEGGNGFKELAIYDQHANNRIDENDPIYKRLYVSMVGPDGEEHLIPLKEAGIGAIYLDYADTLVTLKDGDKSLEREVVRTGVYVNDNGRVGTIQQINVVA
jgi:hypothetical protein